MEKWEQDMMKHVNRPLPETIDDRVSLTLAGLKQKRSRSLKLRLGALASASFVIIIGMSYLSPSFAESLRSLPFVKSIFELVGGVDMRRGSELQLTTELGQEVQIKDQVVTFTESLYDGSKINLSWTVPSYDPDPWAFIENITFTIDGKRIGYGSSASYEKLDNGTYAGTISIAAEGEWPTSFMLGLLSHDETITYANIPVEQQGKYQTYEIDQITTWNDIQVEYKAITLYPTTTELSFSLQNTNSSFWNFQVIDDQGRVLQPISMGGGGFKDENHFKAFFEPFETAPNKIIIKPYLPSPSGETRISGEWNGESMTLDQGKAGSVTILDQQLENDKLTLTYEATGYGIYEQVSRIWLEDSKGLQYHRDRPPTRIYGTYEFQMTFSNVSKIDSMYIVSSKFNTQYLEGLEVSMDIY